MSMQTTALKNRRLNLAQHLSYVAPTLVLMFLWSPIGILQGIYAKYFGVALTTIATVLLISRLFDAVTDPMIGYWSDRYREKFGTRKPFILFGGILFVVSGYFLYVPVDLNNPDASMVVSTPYFLIWFLLFYLSWTLVEIPHMAWAAELSPDSKAKNKIYSLRYVSTHIGMICFYLVPFLPFFHSQEFTPQTLRWTAIAAGIFVLPLLYACIRYTPNGPRASCQPAQKETLCTLRHEIVSNKPFLLLLAAFLLFIAGTGMWFSLIFIMVDSYLKLGHHFASITLFALVISTVSLGFWYWLANHFGKKFVWILGAFMYAVGAIVSSFLEPGQVGIIHLAAVILLAYIGSTPIAAIAPALLAEIIDYSTWKFKTDRSATYFSFYTFAAKAAAAIGGSLGLGIAGWYGFNPAIDVQTESAVFGLHLTASYLSGLLMLLSLFVISMIPMNAHRHRIVRRRLDARLLRESGRDEQKLQTMQ